MAGDGDHDGRARYRYDERPEVTAALAQVAIYFEPEEYGQRVLADSPLSGGWIEVDTWTAPMLRHLTRLYGVNLVDSDLRAIANAAPGLRGLRTNPSFDTDKLVGLADLATLTDLEVLRLRPDVTAGDLPEHLPHLKSLDVGMRRGPIDWLMRYPKLESLSLWLTELTESHLPS